MVRHHVLERGFVGDGGYPRRQLTVPYCSMPPDDLVVRGSPIDECIGSREAKLALRGLCCIPFHTIQIISVSKDSISDEYILDIPILRSHLPEILCNDLLIRRI